MTETITYTYAGYLEDSYGHSEYDDLLHLSTIDGLFIEELEWMVGRCVTVRYWITEEECTKEGAKESFIKKLFGVADAGVIHVYSELSGYLWSDEKLKIGGHDLFKELDSYVTKYLILEITDHGKEKK